MGEVEKTAASLRIAGATLVPEDITGLLGRPPDFSYRSGERIPLPNGRVGAIQRHGLWSIKSAVARPGNLDAQIVELLRAVTEDLAVWGQLTSQFKVDLFCGLFIADGNQGLTISASSLLELGRRGIELEFDVYSLD
ncbi:DUF4279 domain-containing protein [Devosia sp.]|uniref:DUF4279 domain-containing protein n=1 Tax=Devosia sp. TaxID=1871048 RepID=UPI003A8CCB62